MITMIAPDVSYGINNSENNSNESHLLGKSPRDFPFLSASVYFNTTPKEIDRLPHLFGVIPSRELYHCHIGLINSFTLRNATQPKKLRKFYPHLHDLYWYYRLTVPGFFSHLSVAYPKCFSLMRNTSFLATIILLRNNPKNNLMGPHFMEFFTRDEHSLQPQLTFSGTNPKLLNKSPFDGNLPPS